LLADCGSGGINFDVATFLLCALPTASPTNVAVAIVLQQLDALETPIRFGSRNGTYRLFFLEQSTALPQWIRSFAKRECSAERWKEVD
jgi:hypothetical protein